MLQAELLPARGGKLQGPVPTPRGNCSLARELVVKRRRSPVTYDGYRRLDGSPDLDQQNDALGNAGVLKTFSDTMSGARDDRPGLCELMSYVRLGDTVVVWKLDRLGRNTLHILETVKALTDLGVTLVSTTDGIDSSTAAGIFRTLFDAN
jgi:DNA invertase Pin-like site-specific DNA recombinase